VERQIAETCRMRGWHLHAVNCRSNHVHVVVSTGETRPKKIRGDLKAWATRCLKQHANSFLNRTCGIVTRSVSEGLMVQSRVDAVRENWWAERGSIRYIYDESSLEAAIQYVVEGQDGPR
jgi:REP element-mobilizing transposase RayT